jgi:hypothetical protein
VRAPQGGWQFVPAQIAKNGALPFLAICGYVSYYGIGFCARRQQCTATKFFLAAK